MFKERTSKQKAGDKAEEQARRYLEKQGMKLLVSNYRCNCGEIDLIMQHNQTLVFIEVRCRANSRFGSAAESVDRRKQSKIIKAAQFYLQQHRQEVVCRFDVVALTSGTLNWIADAFTL